MRFSEFLVESNNQFYTDIKDVKEWLSLNNIKGNSFINEDLSVEIEGDITIETSVNGKLPVKFGKVSGIFGVTTSAQLVSLIGSPWKCSIFSITNCKTIKTLEGAPSEFSVLMGRNTGIENLKGLPKEKCGELDFGDCSSLTSLEGCSRTVTKMMLMNCHKLKSLVGGPEYVNETFNLSSCDLRSLEGSPIRVHGSYGLSGNKNLTSLEGITRNIGENLVLGDLPKIKSLKNIHKIIDHVGNVEFGDYFFDMLGVILIADRITWIQFMSTRTGIYLDNKRIATILSKYAGKGRDGVMKAQQDLIDANLERVAHL